MCPTNGGANVPTCTYKNIGLPEVRVASVFITYNEGKFLTNTCPFWGPLVSLFGISGDVSSGFKSHSGFCLIQFFAEANVMYILRDPPLLLHVLTSWRLARSWSLPHMHVQRYMHQQRWDLAHILTGNHQHRRRRRHHCASDPTFSTQTVFASDTFSQSNFC